MSATEGSDAEVKKMLSDIAKQRLAEMAGTAKPMSDAEKKRQSVAMEWAWLDKELREASTDAVYAAKIFEAMLSGRGIEHGHLLYADKAVLRVMPYRRYLQTPHWLNLASKCRSNADNRCQVCNAGGEIHAHHRTYERRGFEADTDLIALCNECHRLFHDNGKLAEAIQ